MQNLPLPPPARKSSLGNSENANLLAGSTQSAFVCFRAGNVPPRPKKKARLSRERAEEVKRVRE
jgi:hypothetical protein